MATLNFYVRTFSNYDETATPSSPLKDNLATFTSIPFTGGLAYLALPPFQDQDAMYALYPLINKNGGSSSLVTPTSTGRSITEFYIDNVDSDYDDPAYLNFGSTNYSGSNDGVLLCRTTGSSPYDSEVQVTRSTWNLRGWSLNNYTTFMDEVLDFIAGIISYSRNNPTVNDPRQSASLNDDWNVVLILGQEQGLGVIFDMVLFYPGNDPNYDSLETRTI